LPRPIIDSAGRLSAFRLILLAIFLPTLFFPSLADIQKFASILLPFFLLTQTLAFAYKGKPQQYAWSMQFLPL
jgi:hypothetical protein